MPTLRVDPSGRQAGLSANFGTRARDAIGEFSRVLKAERRRIRQAALRSRQEDLEQGNPRMSGFGGWFFGTITGIPNPRLDDFTDFSVEFVHGLDEQPDWVRWVERVAHQETENFFRRQLKEGHHGHGLLRQLFQAITANPDPVAATIWNTLRGPAKSAHIGFLIPPDPRTEEYIDWMAGFSYGVVDSLISTFVLLPLNLAQSILGICQLVATTQNIWSDLIEYVKKYFKDLDQANKRDDFTKGKTTGRLLFDLVMAWLLYKDVSKGIEAATKSIQKRGPLGALGHEFGKGWGYRAGMRGAGTGSAARAAVVKEAAAMGDETRAGLDHLGVDPEQVRAQTKQNLAQDARDANELMPEAVQVRPPNRATVTIEYKQG
jgi:hypothetical protein